MNINITMHVDKMFVIENNQLFVKKTLNLNSGLYLI